MHSFEPMAFISSLIIFEILFNTLTPKGKYEYKPFDTFLASPALIINLFDATMASFGASFKVGIKSLDKRIVFSLNY